MAKEKRKEKWQRYSKENHVKFQGNDTIIMLVTSLAHEFGVNPKKFQDNKDLEDAVEKALLPSTKKATKKSTEKKPPVTKKVVTKKPAAKKVSPTDNKEIEAAIKKTTTKKPAAKKPAAKKAPSKKVEIKVKPPSKIAEKKKDEVVLPIFKNVREMKDFCVKSGLNKVDGYILKSKSKKTDFLQWIVDNKEKATPPAPNAITTNPNSPSAGIGEMSTGNDNIGDAVESLGNAPTNQPIAADAVVTPEGVKEKRVTTTEHQAGLAPLSTGNDNNDLPTGITESAKAMSHGQPESGEVEPEKSVNPEGDINEMKGYGNAIISFINDSFQARFHGGMPMADFQKGLKGFSALYQYEIQSDEFGVSIKMTDGNGNECRIPEDGYLAII